MKKILSLFFILFSFFSAFAQDSRSIIFSQDYSYENISFLEADLLFENIIIEKYTGDVILIEYDSNNSLIAPVVSLEKDQVLKIENSRDYNSSADYCNIYVYLPVNFHIKDLKIQTQTGIISLGNFNVEEDVELYTFGGDISIKNLKCEYLHAVSMNGFIYITDSTLNYFNLNNTDGNILIRLKKAPVLTSLISTKNGNIKYNFKSQQSLCFEILDSNKITYNDTPVLKRNGFFGTNLNPKNPDPSSTYIKFNAPNGTISFINDQ